LGGIVVTVEPSTREVSYIRSIPFKISRMCPR